MTVEHSVYPNPTAQMGHRRRELALGIHDTFERFSWAGPRRASRVGRAAHLARTEAP